jgi:carbamoyltransferase
MGEATAHQIHRSPAVANDARDGWILGLGGSSHDFAAALMRDGDIKVAVEAERVTRRKHGHALWYQDPLQGAIQYCVDAAGIGREDIDVVVTGDLLPYRARAYCADTRVQVYGHHLCHAASAYMMVPPDVPTAIIVYDGLGSITNVDRTSPLPVSQHETFSFYRAADGQIELLGATFGQGLNEHTDFGNGATNSVGLLYEMITALLGFHSLDTGKTMGLAAWGAPLFSDTIYEHARLGDSVDNVFTFDPYGAFGDAVDRFLSDRGHSFQARADLAASVQEVMTAVLLNCYSLIKDLDFSILLLAGGCALNTVANGVLAQMLPPSRRLFIPPHAGDSGQALGALWLHAREQESTSFQLTFNGHPLMPALARPGRTYSRAEVRRDANRFYPRLVHHKADMSPEQLAEIIAAGQIVGVFNGASEIGPRALGGRSVLADPRDVAMRERINRLIKHREPFRPLAPIILDRHYEEYFWPPAAKDRFMLIVAQANERCREAAPAVVHADGGARVQTVDVDTDAFLVRLLIRFHELTGVPIVLNTSFNRRGEPIVETPEHAFEAFLEMGLDGLYINGDYYVAA